SIVCTIFPQYDWVKQILGDKIDNTDLTLLLDNGVDLHNYQPTVDDIVKISDCDMFIYVGGESDDWVEDVLTNAGNENMTAVNLLDALGSSAKEEEIIEGMQADGHDDEDEEHEHGAEYDEHIWLSLKNAAVLCTYIAQQLANIDPQSSDVYIQNANAYNEKLSLLDNQYQQVIRNAKHNTVLFADRFPFRYLTDDYGLKYYAAFSGCSAETEASFETVSFLADKADELGLNTVLTIEGSDGKIAETVVKNTQAKNQKILSLNSMQSITLDDVETGVEYFSIMQDNLSVLKQALS
ncbi:MAG: metal ABC transporter substrate-binding protein, partial [Eubacterium sp.]